jgi:hypothetical protein
MHNKGLQEDDIQKFHRTAPEQLTDKELLLSTISVAETYRFRTFTVQCHMTSQVSVSGKHKRETSVSSKESTKDDSPLKTDQPDCHGQIDQEALS